MRGKDDATDTEIGITVLPVDGCRQAQFSPSSGRGTFGFQK